MAEPFWRHDFRLGASSPRWQVLRIVVTSTLQVRREILDPVDSAQDVLEFSMTVGCAKLGSSWEFGNVSDHRCWSDR